jgi:FtsP/CotA-like multicopper oxidase with cupredoxin domain
VQQTTAQTRTISRRSLLRASALGLAGIAVGIRPRLGTGSAEAEALVRLPAGTVVTLTMRPALLELVDERLAHVWAYDTAETGPRTPGPVLHVVEGDRVHVEVVNALEGIHAFAVPGVVDSGPIAPGQTVTVSFTAPAAGTYIYLDPLRAPLHRVMGLAGMLVVHPRSGPTPYTDPTPQVANLFGDLGQTAHFPGEAWRPERTWNWVFSCIDPGTHAAAVADPGMTPEAFLARYHPTYFLLNGRSGYFAAHDDATAIKGRVGQPALIRMANVGIATHSPHLHGNHVYVLSQDGYVRNNLYGLDTWPVGPLRTIDALLPFIRPPDAHPWPPSDPSVWTTDLAGDGMKGMVFPMHCHMELSQLANGGNYPHGLLTHWVLTGDLENPPPPTTTTTTTPPTTTTTTIAPPTTTTAPPPTTTTTTSTTTTTTPGRKPPGKPGPKPR